MYLIIYIVLILCCQPIDLNVVNYKRDVTWLRNGNNLVAVELRLSTALISCHSIKNREQRPVGSGEH